MQRQIAQKHKLDHSCDFLKHVKVFGWMSKILKLGYPSFQLKDLIYHEQSQPDTLFQSVPGGGHRIEGHELYILRPSSLQSEWQYGSSKGIIATPRATNRLPEVINSSEVEMRDQPWFLYTPPVFSLTPEVKIWQVFCPTHTKSTHLLPDLRLMPGCVKVRHLFFRFNWEGIHPVPTLMQCTISRQDSSHRVDRGSKVWFEAIDDLGRPLPSMYRLHSSLLFFYRL